MIINIKAGTAEGCIKAQPSKSMAHRSLICGALSKESEISGISFSDDIKATLSCLEMLGAKVQVNGDTVKIGGLNPFDPHIKGKLFCNESGSTLRFLVPLCLVSQKEICLNGTERLFERPLDVYKHLCQSAELEFCTDKTSVTLKGPLKSGKYAVEGNVSSQFISGLLFALPLLVGDSIIEITGAAESLSYIKLTLKTLDDFGIKVTIADEHTLLVPGSQHYRNCNITVEGDYSNSAFFAALNSLGGNVKIEGLPENSFQGDRVYKELFIKLCEGGAQIDVSDCPDLAPILFALAAAKSGAVFTGTARLKLKECDRAAAMKEELAKFGIPVIVEENRVVIENAQLHAPSVILDGHNDHRIVMALSILCTLTGGKIDGAQAVDKSYPAFFRDLAELGISVECL